MSLPPTRTAASPERQISPVSRSPVEKETEGFEAFRMMRPYARCWLVLLPGETEMLRPTWALVLRKTIFSLGTCAAVVMITPWQNTGAMLQPQFHGTAGFGDSRPQNTAGGMLVGIPARKSFALVPRTLRTSASLPT